VNTQNIMVELSTVALGLPTVILGLLEENEMEGMKQRAESIVPSRKGESKLEKSCCRTSAEMDSSAEAEL